MFYSNVEMNEVLYAEADIQAAQYVVIQSYASMANAVNQGLLYGEADNNASQGIISKIANFFKNLGTKVIEFIKKLVNITLSLLLKPFGAKIAIGSGGKSVESAGGGGGGGSSSGSSEETPKSKLAPKSGNMIEIANTLKKLSAYLQSDSPSDVAYKSMMNDTNPFTKNDKAYAKLSKDSSKGSVEAVVNTLKNLVGDIDSTFSNFKVYNNKINKSDEIINEKSSENLLSTAMGGINSKSEQAAIIKMASPNSSGEKYIPKSHPNLSVAFNIIDAKKVSEFTKHASALMSLLHIIDDVLLYSGVISDTIGIVMKNDNANYVRYCLSYGKSIASHTIKVKGDPEKKGFEGEDYNLFGVPSSAALVGSRFFFIRSLEQNMFDTFIPKTVLDDMVKKCPVIKDYVGASYRNVLVSNKAYDFGAIDKTFKSVSLSGGDDVNKFITEVQGGNTLSIKMAAMRIADALLKFKDLDKRINAEDSDGITEGGKRASKAEAIETELAKKGNSASALREFLGNSAKIIRNMSSVTSESCSSIRELFYELEASANCVGVVVMVNTIMYKRDYIHYACRAINELLNDSDYKKKEFKKDSDVTRVRDEIKKILSDLTKISKQYKF